MFETDVITPVCLDDSAPIPVFDQSCIGILMELASCDNERVINENCILVSDNSICSQGSVDDTSHVSHVEIRCDRATPLECAIAVEKNICHDSSPRLIDDCTNNVRELSNGSGAECSGTSSKEAVIEENSMVCSKGTVRKGNEKVAAVGHCDRSSAGLRENDVACGRDGVAHTHPGNKRFRQLVHRFREPYQTSTSRKGKAQITRTIMNMIRNEYGGRLMKRSQDGSAHWVEASDDYFYEKVSHALRSAKGPASTTSSGLAMKTIKSINKNKKNDKPCGGRRKEEGKTTLTSATTIADDKAFWDLFGHQMKIFRSMK